MKVITLQSYSPHKTHTLPYLSHSITSIAANTTTHLLAQCHKQAKSKFIFKLILIGNKHTFKGNTCHHICCRLSSLHCGSCTYLPSQHLRSLHQYQTASASASDHLPKEAPLAPSNILSWCAVKVSKWHRYWSSSSSLSAFYYFCCVSAGPYPRSHRMMAAVELVAQGPAVAWAMQRTTNCLRGLTPMCFCPDQAQGLSHLSTGMTSANVSPLTFPVWCLKHSCAPFINSQTHCSAIQPKEYGK